MRTGSASGLQILFLSFAVILLAVPASTFIASIAGSAPAEAAFIRRFAPFVLGALLLLAVPALRRRVRGYLSRPIPKERRLEVALVALAKVFLGFGFMGALALWFWLTEGSTSLENHLSPAPRDQAFAAAFSAFGMLNAILLSGIFAPAIEEILYRGLLFDAWAERWGAFAATIFTSALFACYHDQFLAAFTSAVVLTCVVRRTGTLWGAILVHSFFNLMLWYPLAGQFAIPDPNRGLGDISTWGFNLTCLLVAAIALPAYIVLAALRPYRRLSETA